MPRALRQARFTPAARAAAKAWVNELTEEACSDPAGIDDSADISDLAALAAADPGDIDDRVDILVARLRRLPSVEALQARMDRGDWRNVLHLDNPQILSTLLSDTCPTAALRQQGEKTGETLLFEAQSALAVDLLLARGADPNLPDRFGRLPVHEASYTAVARRLVEVTKDLDHQDDRGDTALILAAHHGRADVVRVLLAAGVDSTLRNRARRTALTEAERASSMTSISSRTDALKEAVSILGQDAKERASARRSLALRDDARPSRHVRRRAPRARL